MFSDNVSALLDLLQREQDCCARLIEVSKDEQVSLVDNDPQRLGVRISEMQGSVQELQELHSNRRELLAQLAQYLEVEPDRLSLQALADRLDGEDAGRLRERARALMKTGEALYRVNQHTIYLINFSLKLVDRQIAAWTDALTEKDGYDSDGRTTRSSSDAAIVEEKV